MPEPKDQPTPEEQDPKVETEVTEDGGVAVNLEDEEGESPQAQEEAPKEKEKEGDGKADPEKVVIDKKTHDRLFAQSRLLQSTEKQLREIKSEVERLKATPERAPEPAAVDDYDKLAEKDWKAAVRKLGREEALKILDEERKRIEKDSAIEQTRQLQEANAQSVLTKHPELEDPASEKATIWQRILAENPRFVHSPDGPLLTMYKMEEELRSRGYEVSDGKREVERRQTVIATTLKPSRPSAPANGKIVLTREQREFCDSNGITYQDYARSLRQQETGVVL